MKLTLQVFLFTLLVGFCNMGYCGSGLGNGTGSLEILVEEARVTVVQILEKLDANQMKQIPRMRGTPLALDHEYNLAFVINLPVRIVDPERRDQKLFPPCTPFSCSGKPQPTRYTEAESLLFFDRKLCKNLSSFDISQFFFRALLEHLYLSKGGLTLWSAWSRARADSVEVYSLFQTPNPIIVRPRPEEFPQKIKGLTADLIQLIGLFERKNVDEISANKKVREILDRSRDLAKVLETVVVEVIYPSKGEAILQVNNYYSGHWTVRSPLLRVAARTLPELSKIQLDYDLTSLLEDSLLQRILLHEAVHLLGYGDVYERVATLVAQAILFTRK